MNLSEMKLWSELKLIAWNICLSYGNRCSTYFILLKHATNMTVIGRRLFSEWIHQNGHISLSITSPRHKLLFLTSSKLFLQVVACFCWRITLFLVFCLLLFGWSVVEVNQPNSASHLFLHSRVEWLILWVGKRVGKRMLQNHSRLVLTWGQLIAVLECGEMGK